MFNPEMEKELVVLLEHLVAVEVALQVGREHILRPRGTILLHARLRPAQTSNGVHDFTGHQFLSTICIQYKTKNAPFDRIIF